MQTVYYTITANAQSSWTGEIYVDSLDNALISTAGIPTGVTADGVDANFVPNVSLGLTHFSGGLDISYITIREWPNLSQFPNSGFGFDIWSQDLYDDVTNGNTWMNLVTTGTYSLTAGKNTVYYNYDGPTAVYYGVGGTIGFTSSI